MHETTPPTEPHSDTPPTPGFKSFVEEASAKLQTERQRNDLAEFKRLVREFQQTTRFTDRATRHTVKLLVDQVQAEGSVNRAVLQLLRMLVALQKVKVDDDE